MTDLAEIYTHAVKSKLKNILLMKIFPFSAYFPRKKMSIFLHVFQVLKYIEKNVKNFLRK